MFCFQLKKRTSKKEDMSHHLNVFKCYNVFPLRYIFLSLFFLSSFSLLPTFLPSSLSFFFYMGLLYRTSLTVGILPNYNSIKVEKESPGNFPFTLSIFHLTFAKCQQSSQISTWKAILCKTVSAESQAGVEMTFLYKYKNENQRYKSWQRRPPTCACRGASASKMQKIWGERKKKMNDNCITSR